MSPTPHAKIRDWLSKSGYPFELRVGRSFAQADWAVNYSSWYTDLDSGKSRELDILAHMGFGRTLAGTVVFSLCVECKKSTERPWIGFSSDSTFGSGAGLLLYKGPLARMAYTAASSERMSLPQLLPPNTPRVGGLVQMAESRDEGGPGAPYNALLQVRSAVRSLDRLYGQATLENFPDFSTIGIRLPLVVLEGELFTFSLDADGSEHLREVEAVVASVPGDGDGDQALVPVITSKYLPTLAAATMAEAKIFSEGLIPHLGKIIPAYSVHESGVLDDDSEDDVS